MTKRQRQNIEWDEKTAMSNDKTLNRKGNNLQRTLCLTDKISNLQLLMTCKGICRFMSVT